MFEESPITPLVSMFHVKRRPVHRSMGFSVENSTAN